MSTFYIYPLPSQGESDTTLLKSLDSTEFSRILEIPLHLLDTTDSSDLFKDQYWLPPPTATNTAITPAHHLDDTEFDVNTTLVLANRKRSMVKRRKSVLSSSFTVSDEEENKTTQQEEETLHVEKEQENQLYLQENLTFNLQDDAHFSSTTEEKTQMNPYRKEKPDVEQDIPCLVTHQDSPKQEKSAVHPKDSAIDLSLDTQVFDTPSSPPEVSPIPVKKTKKKVPSWSPRKIFSSSSDTNQKKLNKKSSSSSLNSIDSVDSAELKERFHFSSLFSRKSSANAAKKSKQQQQQSQEKQTPQVNHYNYTRLPIHTERAIYRLSHLKLTNPKRPLRDQVVISNHMFWYLSIVSNHTESSTNVHQMITMTKRHHRLQQQQQQQKSKQKNRYPAPPPATTPIPQNKRLVTKKYPAHLNSSSEDEDESEDENLSDSDQEENNQVENKTKKSSFLKTKNKWLSKKKQIDSEEEEEDDIPLAMYQKAKK